MPRTNPSNAATGSKRANNPGTSGTQAPKAKKKYEDPLKNKTFEDPLRKRIETYKADFKIPEFKPYTSYHEYTMPDIDPLTGKPRRKRRLLQPKEEPKKETKKEIKPYKIEPNKVRESPVKMLPPEAGSSVESMKRSLHIMENLNY